MEDSRSRSRGAVRSGLLTGVSTAAVSGSAAVLGVILSRKFGHGVSLGRLLRRLRRLPRARARRELAARGRAAAVRRRARGGAAAARVRDVGDRPRSAARARARSRDRVAERSRACPHLERERARRGAAPAVDHPVRRRADLRRARRERPRDPRRLCVGRLRVRGRLDRWCRRDPAAARPRCDRLRLGARGERCGFARDPARRVAAQARARAAGSRIDGAASSSSARESCSPSRCRGST